MAKRKTMERLDLESLVHVRDGMVKRMFDTALAALYDDCVERSKSKKPRKLTLEITLAPVVEDGPLEQVVTTFSVAKSIPKESFGRSMKVSSKHQGLMFSADTDSVKHDVDQGSLIDQEDED